MGASANESREKSKNDSAFFGKHIILSFFIESMQLHDVT